MRQWSSDILTLARAVAEDEDFRDYCIATTGRTALVQVGCDPNSPPNDTDAPFVLFYRIADTEAGPVSDTDTCSLMIWAGIVPVEGAGQLIERETVRDADNNGLTIFGGAEAIETVMTKVGSIVKTVVLSDKAGVMNMSTTLDGASLYPLQNGVMELELTENRSLGSW